MEKETRSRIQRATQAARGLLEREYAEQLEGVFDIPLDGTIATEPGEHLDAAQRAQRRKLVTAVEHQRVGRPQKADAVAAYLREAAFSSLNRFVALKMLEARDLVQECISRGDQSAGFKEFTGLAPGLVQLPDHGYRAYIESLFDEIGCEVRMLFDRRDPAGLLWPRRQSLLDLLEVLNDGELASVWAEDETIGWVYQYFNGEDERKRMRAESQKAAQSSFEMAVRNQFFTPRYIVEFLTDNTLGLFWLQSRNGQTRLTSDCKYLLQQAEGGRTTHREITRDAKDPRDIKLIDPACGSGHFLLYSFDLFIAIYEEAWDDPASPACQSTGQCLRDDFPNLGELRRTLPSLILRHNLFGVDIDARATQIAALALWMRAQRVFNEFRIDRQDRPAITKTNIVVSEALPGRDQLAGFTETLDSDLARLVERVFEKLDVAGETGSLLDVRTELRDSVRDIYGESGELFKGVDTDRWTASEDRVLEALVPYVEAAHDRSAYGRRLFAEDTARGLAFIDVLRNEFDVVVMNPPFGSPTPAGKARLSELLSRSGHDIGAAFVSHASAVLAPHGLVGALLSTTPWFFASFVAWRESVMLGDSRGLLCAAHLGGGVLDDASVSASAFVIGDRSTDHSIRFLRCIRDSDKPQALSRKAKVLPSSSEPDADDVFLVLAKELLSFPKSPLTYWISARLRRTLVDLPRLEGTAAEVRVGIQASDDPRFVRAWWELPRADVGPGRSWLPLAKGSEYSPLWDDITWVIRWASDGSEVRAFDRSKPQNISFFGRPGVTFPARSVLGFNPRALPAGCGFANMGPTAFPIAGIEASLLMGFLFAKPTEYIISFAVGSIQGKKGVHPNHYEVGVVQNLPWPKFEAGAVESIKASAKEAVAAATALFSYDEITHGYRGFPRDLGSIAKQAEREATLLSSSMQSVRLHREKINALVADALGFSESDVQEMDHEFSKCEAPTSGPWAVSWPEPSSAAVRTDVAGRVLSHLLGIAFGRFPVDEGEALLASNAFAALPEPVVLSEDRREASVLVDDEGHTSDIVAAIESSTERAFRDDQRVLADIVHTLCSDDTAGLRGWMKKQFFEDHVKRYSKSRRKAPIYWQLSSASSGYSLWFYYPRITSDTFYRALNDFVAPKLQHEERRLLSITQSGGATPSTKSRREIANQEAFVEELKSFRDEIVRIAPLWKTCLDDGVQVAFALLWRLVPQHRRWQRQCRDNWEKLCAGDYDWAHTAMHLWPERVVPKCANDRSLAIAHGLEDVFWHEDSQGKWQPKKVPRPDIATLVKRRTSGAVKDALKSLLESPAPVSGRSREKKAPRAKASSKRAGWTRPSALTNDASSPARSFGAVDPELLSKVKEAIAASDDGASKADIIDATGITSEQWVIAMKALRADGSVIQDGVRRWARYRLAGGET